MKNISVFGSTGSIGEQTLALVRQFPQKFNIVGLAAGRNIELLKMQIREFDPKLVVVALAQDALDLKSQFPRVEFLHGEKGLISLAEVKVDTIVMALSGFLGLKPILRALEQGQRLALANKEPVVAAGHLLARYQNRFGGEIFPVDSEHSAVYQALKALGPKENIDKVLLTASGGPFYKQKDRDLGKVTPKEATDHPKWKMGAKLSVDSATMINKGLEVMEARWLFDLEPRQLEVVIHPQSIVHAMAQGLDGALIAHMGFPDMRMPIAYALSYPERLELNLPSLSWAKLSEMTFAAPDLKEFPGLALCLEVNRLAGLYPAALNAANEEAVTAFLQGKVSFTDIVFINEKVLSLGKFEGTADLESIFEIDKIARLLALDVIEKLRK